MLPVLYLAVIQMLSLSNGFVRTSCRITNYYLQQKQFFSPTIRTTLNAATLDISSKDKNATRVRIDNDKLVFNEFNRLGLLPELVSGLAVQDLTEPTDVQRNVIPRLLNGENLVMAASTGSGKTLAFVLPIIQNLLIEEQQGYTRLPKRPRCLVLVPTRELARQVLATIKSLSHYAKVSSCAVLGGEEYSLQKKSLDRVVDIVVASPGRLMQHKEKGNVYLNHITHIVIDEVDTMLTQGFGSDIRALLRSAMTQRDNLKDKSVQVAMASATLTKAVRALLEDVKGFNTEYSDPDNKTPKKLNGTESRISLNIVEVDGVHRSLPNVTHNVVETKGADKIVILTEVLQSTESKSKQTLIFCNTVSSCKAIEFALTGAGTSCLSYHGDLSSTDRASNLEKFRNGEERYLVCTDIAARGLDIPEVNHVIMFDFPLNAIDYLHRAGRTGRAGRKGLVTAIVTKRDVVLSDAIQAAVAKGLPLDSLSSSKKDYEVKGRLGGMLNRSSKKITSVTSGATTSEKKRVVRIARGDVDRTRSSSSTGSDTVGTTYSRSSSKSSGAGGGRRLARGMASGGRTAGGRSGGRGAGYFTGRAGKTSPMSSGRGGRRGTSASENAASNDRTKYSEEGSSRSDSTDRRGDKPAAPVLNFKERSARRASATASAYGNYAGRKSSARSSEGGRSERMESTERSGSSSGRGGSSRGAGRGAGLDRNKSRMRSR